MSVAGSGAGEGVALDADAPASSLDDGHRPFKQLDISRQSQGLSSDLEKVSIADELKPVDTASTSQASANASSRLAHPADLVSPTHSDARNGHSSKYSEDHARQTSAESKESYSTCDSIVHSATSSSINALEDGESRAHPGSANTHEQGYQTTTDQYAPLEISHNVSLASGPEGRIVNGRVSQLQDSPTTASNSPIPTPNSEEITALRMSGQESMVEDPYRGSSASTSADLLSPAPAQGSPSRPSTSQSTRVPSNISHDPLRQGEMPEHAHEQASALFATHLQESPATARTKGASTQAQNGHEYTEEASDPFVDDSNSVNDATGSTTKTKKRTPVSARPDAFREEEDEFAETLSSSPTTNRNNLFNVATQQSTSGSAPRSPRSSMQRNRGEGSTAASAGHHTSSSSIGYRRASADSTAPLAVGSTSSARPSHGHEPSSSNSQTSQSVFAQQQSAPPFSQTVPAEQSRERSADPSRSSSSRGKEKDRGEGANGRDRDRSSRRQLGEWTLGKTLGAGSMGKVKLGVSTVTGEKVFFELIEAFQSAW